MDKKAADVKDEKSAKPENDEHNSQYEEHEKPTFLGTGCRATREYTQDIRGEIAGIRCLEFRGCEGR